LIDCKIVKILQWLPNINFHTF